MDTIKPFFHLACTLVLLGMLAGTLPAVAQQSSATNGASALLPDSPGAVRSDSDDKKNDSIVALAQAQSEPTSPSPAQTAPAQKPVGTAAAEASNVNAVAASQPAGVAIAPAKQRRVRTIILRTGAIIAAGVAVGAIVALTAATPPKPPGAH
jgi:cytoskeletal protein RodZ